MKFSVSVLILFVLLVFAFAGGVFDRSSSAQVKRHSEKGVAATVKRLGSKGSIRIVPPSEAGQLGSLLGDPCDFAAPIEFGQTIQGSLTAADCQLDDGTFADFYVFTGHKLYGPTGIGVLYAKHEHLVAMRPFNGGGEMIREVAQGWVTYGDPPHKFEAGTPAIVESIGLGAAIDYVNSIGKERIAAHEHGLLTYAQERLREINSLRLIGTARDKGPVISFELKGAHAHDVATVIDRQGVAVRAGTHCVMPLLERFNVTATCRASFGMYNTKEEVDHLVQALIKARELFA